MTENDLSKRADGKYEEALGQDWVAEYFERSENSLWDVKIYHRDVAEWHSRDFLSLQEARKAARDYYDQL